jgi:hypothetical protein
LALLRVRAVVVAALTMLAMEYLTLNWARAAEDQQPPLDMSSDVTHYGHLSEFFDKEPGGETAIDLNEGSKRFAVLQSGRWHNIKKRRRLQFYFHTGKEAGPRTAMLVEGYRVYSHGTIAPNQCVSIFRNSPWPTDNRSNLNPFPRAQNTNLAVDQFRKCHGGPDLAHVNAALKKPWHAEIENWDTLQAFRGKITDGFFGQVAPGGHISQAFSQADPHLLPQQTWRLIAYTPNPQFQGAGSTLPFTIDLEHGDEKYVVLRTVTPNSEDDPYYVLVLE